MGDEVKRYALLMCGEDSEYLLKMHGGTYGIFMKLLLESEEEEKWDLYKVVQGHFPEQEDLALYDGFVISGSCYDAHANDQWILHLIDLVNKLDSMHKKILGICFGHQIIGRALGGKVGRSPNGWDIGVKAMNVSSSLPLPFSSLNLPSKISIYKCHRDEGLTNERMIDEVEKYVEHLKLKYPNWNRTLGADHFLVTCHDIGVKATKGVPHLMKNSIRVVCSSSYDDDDYIPHKDVTLPQVQLPFFHPPGGNDIKKRNTLAFWAGRSDSRLKHDLIAMWDNDTELDIQNNRVDLRATGPVAYMDKLYKSKFCLCPHGPVGSSRIADSIHFGCVPVIMSNYYDLPFNDILDWSQFSVVLKETDVYQLRDILRSISEKHFITLNQNIVKIQKHFKWNTPPVRLDAFHMVMYELWLRRHLIRY